MEKLPQLDVAIIGAHKSGSSALFSMLKQHPQIHSHNTGQLPFFLREENYKEQYPKILEQYYDTKSTSKKIKLMRDGTLFTDPQSIKNLKELCPNIKVIVILREPVSRAYSAYCYAVAKGFEDDRDFLNEIKRQVNNPKDSRDPSLLNYYDMGCYFSNLSKLEKNIDSKNFIILKSEDLKVNPIDCCQHVFSELALDKFKVKPMITNQTRKSRFDNLERIVNNPDSLIKKFKHIVPLSFRRKIRNLIISINKTKTPFSPLSLDASQYLNEIYKDENKKLKEKWKISFDE